MSQLRRKRLESCTHCVESPKPARGWKACSLASQPYKLAAVRTSPACQARARFVDADKARPSVQDGWIFNDLIRVPNAGCATQQAVVRVWRRPANAVPPKLDGQGRSRIYLQESVAKAKAGTLPPIPMYAATMTLEGLPCR